MDGEPVTGEPSKDNGNSGGDGAVSATPFTDAFVKTFPGYMVMGMTYDEFWHGDIMLPKYYREAYKLRQKEDEWRRWRQGAYFYDALMRVAPVMRANFGKGEVKPGKYPEEPWPLTQREADERAAKRERENTEKFIKQLEAESERNLKMRNKKEASEDGRD